MIGVLGARIWIDGRVNFADPTNLYIAAASLIIGISDMSWTRGDFTFSGIINATVMAVIGYQILNRIAKARGTNRS
jgi:NCS2 family nucleobase:cation symporter-2